MSQIDNQAKAAIKKADGWIARHLVKIVLFTLFHGISFALGAWIF